MATVNFKINKKKGLANIYVRVVHRRTFDKETPIGIFIDSRHWDSKNQKVRNLIEAKDKGTINSHLLELEAYIIRQINAASWSEEILTLKWLKKLVWTHFNRPEETDGQILDRTIYYTDFCDWWIEEVAPKSTIGSGKLMPTHMITRYKNVNTVIKKFEADRKEKILLNKFDIEKLREVVRYLMKDEEYSHSTTETYIKKVVVMLKKAEGAGLKVNTSYRTERVVVPEDDDNVIDAYLTSEEIVEIVNFDFSHDMKLDNARDTFIMGAYTGLRISDFLGSLKVPDIEAKRILCFNRKTKAWVKFPVHPHLRSVFRKHNGKPPKTTESTFNRNIKLVCEAVGINEEMEGKVAKSAKGSTRNKKDIYKKHELIASHTCRRSFTTNLYGKIPDQDLCDMGGWTNLKMMYHYVKEIKLISGDSLAALWELEEAELLAAKSEAS
jgi:hypothetical protein